MSAGLAELMGANPATGQARYLTHDHLGSTREVYDQSKNSLSGFSYTPYGSADLATGPSDVTRRYTGHDFDPITGHYFAPFRYYSPTSARWLKQDPMGMINGPNMYGYVGGNPIMYYDPYGLKGFWGSFWGSPFPWIIGGGVVGAVIGSFGGPPGAIVGGGFGMFAGYLAAMAWETYHIPEIAAELAEPWVPMFNDHGEDLIDASEPCP